MLNHAGVTETLILLSPHSTLSIVEIHTEFGFVCKEYGSQVTDLPSCTISCKLHSPHTHGSMELYIIINGALTGIRYRDEVLHPIVRPFAGAIGAEFV
jgi:hypothetical protein